MINFTAFDFLFVWFYFKACVNRNLSVFVVFFFFVSCLEPFAPHGSMIVTISLKINTNHWLHCDWKYVRELLKWSHIVVSDALFYLTWEEISSWHFHIHIWVVLFFVQICIWSVMCLCEHTPIPAAGNVYFVERKEKRRTRKISSALYSSVCEARLNRTLLWLMCWSVCLLVVIPQAALCALWFMHVLISNKTYQAGDLSSDLLFLLFSMTIQ